MELFNKISKIIKAMDTAANNEMHREENNTMAVGEDIVLASSSHIVEDDVYGNGDSVYHVSFQLNDTFKEAKSHAGEIELLNTYAPADEYGQEGTYPYLAIQLDDAVYHAVAEFKKSGTFTGALDITPLEGKFYFKAKMNYYQHMMYFYGLDRCDGFWENNGLCIVYPKSYAGTENEIRLMQVLDKAAESYQEKKNA